ncbi:MAG: hypothetical protein K0Q95_3327 [Bacteroidota bacterium]|nr:hypothetical protein [Bacteroidota bacterium]
MNLKLLFTLHALITFFAGIVLIVAPQLIPSTVGITLDPSANLICYLLAASEISLSVLSFLSRKITDQQALKAIIISLITLHLTSGLLEVYACILGTSSSVLINVLLRIVVSGLFFYYGIYKRDRGVHYNGI